MASSPAILQLDNSEIQDRGLTYGDGFFETLRVANGEAPLLAWHRRRFIHAASRLKLPLDGGDFDRAFALAMASPEAVSGNLVIKLLVTAGAGGRGYRRAPGLAPIIRVQVFGWSPRPAGQVHWGLRLGISEVPCPDGGILAGVKHLNRLPQVLASNEVGERDWDDALMLDTRGAPLELTAMNFFALFEDGWKTPPLDRAGVAGVMRQFLLDEGEAVTGQSFKVCHLSLERLKQAHELFACNSVAGILPVRSIGVWRWAVGDQTRAVQSHVAGLFGQQLTHV